MAANRDEKNKVAEILNALTPPWHGTLMERLGIEVTAISVPDCGPDTTLDTVTGQMPVTGNTQPFGTLHGGATAALIETLGSILANLVVTKPRLVAVLPASRVNDFLGLTGADKLSPDSACVAVGQHLAVTHLRPVGSGTITGQARVLESSTKAVTTEVSVTHDGEQIAVGTLRCKLLPRP